MTAENKSSAELQALIAQGDNCRNSEDFDVAINFYKQALDLDSHTHAAYWGILLSERGCKDDSDILFFGCFDKDENYILACQYADEKSKSQYILSANLAALFCHTNIITLLNRKGFRAAELRAKSYDESDCAIEEIKKNHQILLQSKDLSKWSPDIVKSFLSLMSLYKKIDDHFERSNMPRFFDASCYPTIKKMYSTCMNNLLEEIVSKEPDENKEDDDPAFAKTMAELTNGSASEKPMRSCPNLVYDGAFYRNLDWYRLCRQRAAQNFAKYSRFKVDISDVTEKVDLSQSFQAKKEQAESWASPYQEQICDCVGEDGAPNDVSERWHYLAKYLIDKKLYEDDFDYTLLILYAFEKALMHDNSIYRAESDAFLDDALKAIGSLWRLSQLVCLFPSEKKLYRRALEIIISDPDTIQDSYKDSFSKADHYLSVPIDIDNYQPSSNGKEIDQIVESLNSAIKKYDERLTKKLASAEPVLKKLDELSNGKTDEFIIKWNRYSEELQIDCEKRKAELSEKAAALIKLKKDYAVAKEKQYKKYLWESTKKSIALSALNILMLLVISTGCVFSYLSIVKPDLWTSNLMIANTPLFIGIMIACGVAFAICQGLVTKRQEEYLLYRLLRFDICRVVCIVSMVLTLIASLMGAGILIYVLNRPGA